MMKCTTSVGFNCNIYLLCFYVNKLYPKYYPPIFSSNATTYLPFRDQNDFALIHVTCKENNSADRIEFSNKSVSQPAIKIKFRIKMLALLILVFRESRISVLFYRLNYSGN